MENLHTDRDYILSKRLPLSDRKVMSHLISGVYYLISADLEIVYVGQSMRLKNRIYSHINKGEISFKWFAYIECWVLHHQSEQEKEAIVALKPKYNVKYHPDKWPEIERKRLEKQYKTLRERRFSALLS